MKYVILRCEDTATGPADTPSLLENARLVRLQALAQAGAAGMLRPDARRQAVARFALHRALVGVGADDAEGAPARCYAAGANVPLAEGETAWCCDLVTQRDGRMLDPRGGRITTNESELLLRSLDEGLGSETLRWAVGDGPHHLLITTEPELQGGKDPALPPPELLVGEAWRDHLPRGAQGDALAALLEQSAEILEAHSVNRVRVDLGENPANLPWLWGPTSARAARQVRAAWSGAVSSSSFVLRGLARELGWTWEPGASSFEEPALKRWLASARRLIRAHDLTYLHVAVDTADPVARLCAMERLDRLAHALTETLAAQPWRLLVTLDDRRHGAVPFVAIGTGLPQQPVAKLDAPALSDSPLAFTATAELFSWFTRRAS